MALREWAQLFHNCVLQLKFLGVLPVMSRHETARKTGTTIPESLCNHSDKMLWHAGNIREDFRVEQGVVLIWLNEEHGAARRYEKKLEGWSETWTGGSGKKRKMERRLVRGGEWQEQIKNVVMSEWGSGQLGRTRSFSDSEAPHYSLVWCCQWLWSHSNVMLPQRIKAYQRLKFNMLPGELSLKLTLFLPFSYLLPISITFGKILTFNSL